MTCLHARQVRLHVTRGNLPDQYPTLVVPERWTTERVLEYARSVHEPLGHVVAVRGNGAVADVWVPDPAGFADYKTGEIA